MNYVLRYTLTVFMLNVISAQAVVFRSQTSAIELSKGVTLQLDLPINKCNGRIVKLNGSNILGLGIVFVDGVFIDNGNNSEITGDVSSDTDKVITLTGNNKYKGKGASVVQSLSVAGQNNKVAGDVLFGDDIWLQDDSTGVTCALLRQLEKNIFLNGGALFLEEDLVFINDKKFKGNGKIHGNGRSIILGKRDGDWEGSIHYDNISNIHLNALLNLSETWTFSGLDNCIEGNNNSLFLNEYGRLVVDKGATLCLRNIQIHDINANSIICLDDTSKVVFDHVTLILDSSYTFSRGSFIIKGYLDLVGTSTFMISVSTTCTLSNYSTIKVYPGMTLGYDSPVENRNHLYCAGKNSSIYLDNASLYVTSTGLNLQRGKLLVDGEASLYIDNKLNDNGFALSESGIQFGDMIDENQDFILHIFPASILHLFTGNIRYMNLKKSSMKMDSTLSSLAIHRNTALSLYTPLYLNNGRLLLAKNGALLNFSGESIQGNVEIIKA